LIQFLDLVMCHPMAASLHGLLVLTALAAGAASSPLYRKRGAPIAQRVADLVGRMTVQEKVAELVSLWTHGNNYDYITQTYGSTGVGAAYGFWLQNSNDPRTR
jgi:hypothetical protein